MHDCNEIVCDGGEQKVLSTFSKVVQSRVKLWSHSAECEISCSVEDFLILFLSVTGALPPYPHKLLCTKV